MADWESTLIAVGRETVAGITRTVLSHGTSASCQLQASRFYEALRAELALTPNSAADRQRVLAAAMAECEGIATPAATPLFILARVRTGLALLETAFGRREHEQEIPGLSGRPRLRVVQGGRT